MARSALVTSGHSCPSLPVDQGPAMQLNPHVGQASHRSLRPEAVGLRSSGWVSALFIDALVLVGMVPGIGLVLFCLYQLPPIF